MSYDLYFWQQTKPLPLPPVDVAKAILDNQPPESLQDLPIESINRLIKEAFPKYNPPDDACIRTADGSIDFGWGSKHFVAMVYGLGDAAATIVRILGDHGFALYDPQEDKRYDAEDGTAVGTPPEFRSPTAEQKAEREQLMKMAMAAGDKIASQKKGCMGIVLLLLLPITFAAGVYSLCL